MKWARALAISSLAAMAQPAWAASAGSFVEVNLPGSVDSGASMCRYPIGKHRECFSMKEARSGTVKSVHLPDGTTLVTIEDQDFLFHVPSVHVTYRSCYLPLSAYLSEKDHGLGGCTGWKPDSPHIPLSERRDRNPDYKDDLVKFGAEIGIHLDGSSRPVCNKRYVEEDVHLCMDKQDEAGDRLKAAQKSLLFSFAQASSDGERMQADLQTTRLSLCVLKAAVDGAQSDALESERCWLTERLKPIPGVVEHPTILGR